MHVEHGLQLGSTGGGEARDVFGQLRLLVLQTISLKVGVAGHVGVDALEERLGIPTRRWRTPTPSVQHLAEGFTRLQGQIAVVHRHHRVRSGMLLPNLPVRQRPNVQLPFHVVVDPLQFRPGTVQGDVSGKSDRGVDLHGTGPKGPHLGRDDVQRVAHQEQGLVLEWLLQEPGKQAVGPDVLEQQLFAVKCLTGAGA